MTSVVAAARAAEVSAEAEVERERGLTAAGGRMRRRDRTGVAATGLVLMVLGLVLSSPVLVLCALVACVAGLLGRRVAGDLVLPAALLGLVGAAVLTGQAAHLLDVDARARPGWVAAAYLAIAVGSVAAAARPARTCWTTPPVRLRFGWLTRIPAVGAGLVGAAQLGAPGRSAGWAFQGTDLAQHMIMLAALQTRATLDYSVDLYPRGLHMLLAMTFVPDAPAQGSAALLVTDMQVVAAVNWLALGVMLWTTSSLVQRLCQGRSVRPAVVVAAASAASALPLLDDDFLSAFVYMGAAPTLLAMTVVLVLPMLPLLLAPRLSGPLPTLALLAASTMVLAHLWQALVAVPVVTAVARGWALPAAARARQGMRGLAGVTSTAVVVLVCAAAAVPAVVGTLVGGGLGIAAIPGLLPGVWQPGLAAALLVALAAAARQRTAVSRMLLGTIAGLLVVTGALLVGAGAGVDLDQYYARKSLWFLWVLLVPAVLPTVLHHLLQVLAALSAVAARAGAAAGLLRVAVTASCAALAFAYVLPQHLSTSSLVVTALRDEDGASPSARRLQVALEHGRAHAPATVVPVVTGTLPVPETSGSHIVSKLLSFQTGQPLSIGRYSEVCRDVRMVAGAGPAVIVTDLDPAMLRRMAAVEGCGDVPVVQAPGGGAETGFMRKVFEGELALAERAARPG